MLSSGTSNQSGRVEGERIDIAGVLRRNQACLNCRRRKLKCDAARPNCSTCVRSYKHLLRTNPKTNPVLCCEYDDGPSAAPASTGSVERVGSTSHSPETEDEDDGNIEGRKRKKRPVTRGRESRERDVSKDGTELEREALMLRIAELEAQVKAKEHSPNDSSRAWGASSMPDLAAPSPTAFLEMLSSAASAQVHQSMGPAGLRHGAANDTMMGAAHTWGDTPVDSTGLKEHSGFTPLFPSDSPRLPSHRDSTHGASGAMSPPSTSRQGTRNSPSGADLSPNAIFTFSPVPSGPVASGSSGQPAHNTNEPHSGENLNWPPPPDANGNIQPSTRVEGPWRGVETVETIFAASMKATFVEGQSGMGINTNVDDLPPLDEAVQQQLLLELFWPGWPPNLPEPNIVNDLVEAFFELAPNVSRLLHRSRFLARLALPPTHSNFPHAALIHAICAASAAWCTPSVYERSSYVQDSTWMAGTEKGGGRAGMSFQMRQAAFAKEAVQDGLNTGNRLFDVVRAMIILSRVFIDDTRMLECWAYCGLVARMILPLGLNVRSAELSLKSVMLPPPGDALEREERRAAIWMAFYHDTIASSASGWGTSISLDELSVPLPVSVIDFEAGQEYMEPNPQDIESLDIWTKHPVPDPFVLTLKAAVILNRVNRFVRKWKNRRIRDDDDLDGLQKPEFRELANAIACFQMSFPQALRNPCKLNHKKKLDIDLISAHMLPHAASICLHEPFADITDPNDASTRRMIAATQALVQIVQQLAGVTNDGSQSLASIMHSSASVCLVTAARTSLLFYRYALNIGDAQTADSHRMDIEMVRMALQQFGLKFKIGHHHSQLIEYFLDRATHPTLEKLSAHYPEHPRPGAPELHRDANLGVCILNALNVKRGYWRLPGGNTGTSPFISTPDSLNPTHRTSASENDSPNAPPPGLSTTSSSGQGSGSGSGSRSASIASNNISCAPYFAAVSGTTVVEELLASGKSNQAANEPKDPSPTTSNRSNTGTKTKASYITHPQLEVIFDAMKGK
ncbi:hypothetical protein M231_04371 [Tremella mesenterica]|uniref:Zn(2)-C6 fungal-type domain-containing protein n=1 Tax=Tremella mesenterica TaxID=5217 RepID=A0A4Q1BKQ1_TREME|nr:hypothetical protein M231_04371 [Tremella mesenterica]